MCFFKKKKANLPTSLGHFPIYPGNIKGQDSIIDKPQYIRYECYAKDGISSYKQMLSMHGFKQVNDVKFELDSKNYIIIEKEFTKYKIAYHMKK